MSFYSILALSNEAWKRDPTCCVFYFLLSDDNLMII